MSRNRLFAFVVAMLPAVGPPRRPRHRRRSISRKAQQIVTQICAACHGADGNSADAANPNLAGQHADYITLQLAHFKAGIRVNAVMQGMVATLSDADMKALGVYFSQQKPKGAARRTRDRQGRADGCIAAATRRRRARLRVLPFADRRRHRRRTFRASAASTPTTATRS